MGRFLDWFLGRADHAGATSGPPAEPGEPLPPPDPGAAIPPDLSDVGVLSAKVAPIDALLRFLRIRNPDEVVAGYLDEDETIILMDGPALSSFLLFEIDDIVRWAMAVAVIAVGVRVGGQVGALVAVVAAVALAVMVGWTFVKAMRAYFRRYVFTPYRVLVCEGVISRTVNWIPWGRVTDVSIKQRYWERLLGFGTVQISSANEASGLRELKDVGNPLFFARVIVALNMLRQAPLFEDDAQRIEVLRKAFRETPARARQRMSAFARAIGEPALHDTDSWVWVRQSPRTAPPPPPQRRPGPRPAAPPAHDRAAEDDDAASVGAGDRGDGS